MLAGVDLSSLAPGQRLRLPQVASIAAGEGYSSSSSSSCSGNSSSKGGVSAAVAARQALVSGVAPADGVVAVKIQVRAHMKNDGWMHG